MKLKEETPVNATGPGVANFDPLLTADKKQTKPLKRKLLDTISQSLKKRG